jgi:hypothetical protein
MRGVIAKWAKQFLNWRSTLDAIKTVKQSINFLHRHTCCNIAPKFPETSIKENYIVVNFVVMVKSESNIVLLRNRLNSYMSLYFLLQRNEGRAVFLTLRSNSVWTCSYSVAHHLCSQAAFIASSATGDRWASVSL